MSAGVPQPDEDVVGAVLGVIVCAGGINGAPFTRLPSGPASVAARGGTANGFAGRPGLRPPAVSNPKRAAAATSPAVAAPRYAHRRPLRARSHSVRRLRSSGSDSFVRVFSHAM